VIRVLQSSGGVPAPAFVVSFFVMLGGGAMSIRSQFMLLCGIFVMLGSLPV
jgi:hypothetical protein